MKALLICLTFCSLNAGAQDFSAMEIHERPLNGGMERGIPGLMPDARPNSTVLYYVAVWGRPALDRNLPTHVIVTGHGGKAGTLFQNVSAARAQKYAEVFPDHQVMLITVNELDDDDNARKLESWGFTILHGRSSMLSVSYMVDEMRVLKKVASFDLYSHANEANGASLDADYLSKNSREVRVLKGLFTANAWAAIHGCNSGWSVAPALADMWGIPVSGSFTGTHFERLHTAGDFYPYDLALAPPGPFAVENPLSYNQPISCAGGGCMRMHPDPYRYWGEWGVATHGLGFMRFFCGPVRSPDCERRMALSLVGYIGKTNLNLQSTAAEFTSVLKEYMCPIHRDQPVRNACEQGIDRALASGDMQYTPFIGKSSVCNATLCWEPQAGEVSIAFMEAVQAFLRGIQAITVPNAIAIR
ncbi:MAG: hypothetical protein KF799_08810 [Bdellovibrionales bacterium]|nr:hypothetical protein [Bdellovibrionales bacterium]